MPGFAVDTHPQKQKIIDGILSGETIRAIASSAVPPLQPMTIQRYKTSVIKPMLERAAVSERILGTVSGLKDKPKDLSDRSPAIQAVQKAIQDAPALSIFRQRLEKLHSRIDRTLDKAESAVRVERDEDGKEVFAGPDITPLAPLFNAASKNLEMLGRATGELEPQGGSGVSIQIVCPSAAGELPRVTFANHDQLTIEASPEEEGMLEIGLQQK